jgi:hypothetical protein
MFDKLLLLTPDSPFQNFILPPLGVNSKIRTSRKFGKNTDSKRVTTQKPAFVKISLHDGLNRSKNGLIAEVAGAC